MPYVLTISCADRVGIVAAAAGVLAAERCNIVQSQQYGDPVTGRFFMRVRFDAPEDLGTEALLAVLRPVVDSFQMEWHLSDPRDKARVLVMVSREGHCLNDLLYRSSAGALSAEIVAVVSNHDTHRGLVEAYGVPYHHLPVTAATKQAQERKLLALVDSLGVELVVLARYMQILSEPVCRELAGRLINIHHAFLPGFKGARPYQQARDRGVKLIGATAHYVTPELDDGPIIEQDVARVDHSLDETELAAVGRDIECVVLARAVQWHLEHRVLVDGNKTVVFR